MGLFAAIQDTTLLCSEALDNSFEGARASAESSATFLAAVVAVSSLSLDAVIDLYGAATMSTSAGWPASGITLAPNTTLTLTSTGGGVLDMDMSAYLIKGLSGNTFHLNNLTLINLCSTTDFVSIPNWFWHGNGVRMISALPILGLMRPFNPINSTRRLNLMVENVTMYVPRRDLEYMTYW